jgi:hypothetical protein
MDTGLCQRKGMDKGKKPLTIRKSISPVIRYKKIRSRSDAQCFAGVSDTETIFV